MDSFLMRRTGAECIGVFFLVLAACGSVMIGGLTGAYGHMGMALSPGLVVMVMVAATGHLSMAHLNPAVTLAFALTGHFPWREVPFYISGQLIAAALGAAVLRFLFGNVFVLGANQPAGPIVQSLVMEVLVTAILMFVIAAVATDSTCEGLAGGAGNRWGGGAERTLGRPDQRRVNEPGALFRSSPDFGCLDGPLDLLCRPDCGSGLGRLCLRISCVTPNPVGRKAGAG